MDQKGQKQILSTKKEVRSYQRLYGAFLVTTLRVGIARLDGGTQRVEPLFYFLRRLVACLFFVSFTPKSVGTNAQELRDWECKLYLQQVSESLRSARWYASDCPWSIHVSYDVRRVHHYLAYARASPESIATT